MSELKARLLCSWACYKDSTDHWSSLPSLSLLCLCISGVKFMSQGFSGIRECSNVSECTGYSSIVVLCMSLTVCFFDVYQSDGAQLAIAEAMRAGWVI